MGKHGRTERSENGRLESESMAIIPVVEKVKGPRHGQLGKIITQIGWIGEDDHTTAAKDKCAGLVETRHQTGEKMEYAHHVNVHHPGQHRIIDKGIVVDLMNGRVKDDPVGQPVGCGQPIHERHDSFPISHIHLMETDVRVTIARRDFRTVNGNYLEIPSNVVPQEG
ncbi:MAG: hypothetical protein L6437_12120 [Kiritimatiellae bacterium]|nr:hypothetical protein [Kiritimatiellia bacterium]